MRVAALKIELLREARLGEGRCSPTQEMVDTGREPEEPDRPGDGGGTSPAFMANEKGRVMVPLSTWNLMISSLVASGRTMVLFGITMDRVSCALENPFVLLRARPLSRMFRLQCHKT